MISEQWWRSEFSLKSQWRHVNRWCIDATAGLNAINQKLSKIKYLIMCYQSSGELSWKTCGESQHEKWTSERTSESEMSILRVGKSSVIQSKARVAKTTDPIHLLVMLEEQIIFPFLVISHCTNLRVISLSQKQVRKWTRLIFTFTTEWKWTLAVNQE